MKIINTSFTHYYIVLCHAHVLSLHTLLYNIIRLYTPAYHSPKVFYAWYKAQIELIIQ